MHEKLNQIGRAEEQETLERGIEAIVKASGRRPRGDRAPRTPSRGTASSSSSTPASPYDSSLKGDDIPSF